MSTEPNSGIGTTLVKIPDPSTFNLKIHDFHCHIHKELGDNQTQFGISSMCIMPAWKTLETYDFKNNPPNDFTNGDAYAEKLNRISGDFNGWQGDIYKFLPVDFAKTPAEFDEYIERNEIAGIKLHPLQGFDITRETLDPYIKSAIERDLILYVHTDWVPSTEWKQVKNRMPETFSKIAGMYPEIPIIMGHSGFNDSYVNIWKILKKYPNVYAETSFAPTPQELEKVIYKVDPKRVVFGSSYPLSGTAGEVMKVLKMHRVSEAQKLAVFYDNAIRLLGDKPYIRAGESRGQE